MLVSSGQCLARATFAMTEALRNGEPFNLLDENILKKADRNILGTQTKIERKKG